MPTLALLRQQFETVPLQYQLRYLTSLTNALDDYISWRDIHAPGSKWQRFTHFQHGSDGYRRAKELKFSIEHSTKTFFDILQLTGEALVDSGSSRHSLKRFIFQQFTGEEVINSIPAMNNRDFDNLYYATYRNEVEGLRRANLNNLNQSSFFRLTVDLIEKLNLLDLQSTEENGMDICAALCITAIFN